MVYIAYFTELNSKILDYAQKRRICRENCKYALDERFHGHFCPRRKPAKPCHPGHACDGRTDIYRKWKIVQYYGRPETAISKKGGYIHEHTMWWTGPSGIRDFQCLDFGDGILHNLGSPVFSFGNPKISQDKIFENPGIGIWKNPRIPGYPRFPLMPGDETKKMIPRLVSKNQNFRYQRRFAD